jgi:hypothetical protein
VKLESNLWIQVIKVEILIESADGLTQVISYTSSKFTGQSEKLLTETCFSFVKVSVKFSKLNFAVVEKCQKFAIFSFRKNKSSLTQTPTKNEKYGIYFVVLHNSTQLSCKFL